MQISPDRWGAVLADVSGKGVAAALLASLLQGAFFAGADADSSLSEVIGGINRYICARSRHARFATVFAVTVDAGRTSAKWVSAGHCPTLLVRKDGAIQWLKPKSFPLGLFADAEFEESELLLSAGDKLVIYSDGVSEANNRSHAQFGEERLRRAAGENAAAGPQQLFEALLKEVQEFYPRSAAKRRSDPAGPRLPRLKSDRAQRNREPRCLRRRRIKIYASSTHTGLDQANSPFASNTLT